MRFNRRLSEIKAISFDLDDTLYSNKEVMLATAAAMKTYFRQLLGSKQAYDIDFWSPYRQQALRQKPILTHDVTEARRLCYQLGLQALGYKESQAIAEANFAMVHFCEQRNQVTISQNIFDFLDALAVRFPLVAISNGNVCTKTIGLKDYFLAVYHADQYFKQKPETDLFQQALSKLNIPAKQLLHVGDCGHSDIYGALRAGCQTAWVNTYDVGKPIKVIPHIELSNVTDLTKIL